MVPLDDFKVIHGMDFFIKAKVSIIPHLGGILNSDECSPSIVEKIKNEDTVGVILTLQIKTNIKKGAVTYLATLVETEVDQ